MNSNIWFVGDTHFSHSNIIKETSIWEDKSSCRDFKTIEEHDFLLLNNINTFVKENDILYHHGDFSMAGKDNVWKFRKKINCKNIHFISGNHDNAINRNQILKTDEGFINSRNLFSSFNQILEKKSRKTNNNYVSLSYLFFS